MEVGDSHYIEPVDYFDLNAKQRYHIYAYLTYWIVPSLFSIIWLLIIFSSPIGYLYIFGIAFVFWILENSASGKGIIGKPSKLLLTPIYKMILRTSGIKVKTKDVRQIRYSWLFLFGAVMSGFIAGITMYSFILIIPLFFVIYKRYEVLDKIFKIAYMPRYEYFAEVSDQTILRKYNEHRNDEIKSALKRNQKFADEQLATDTQYFQFLPPKLIVRLLFYVFIFVSPFIFVIGGVGLIAAITKNQALYDILSENAYQSFALGFFAIFAFWIISVTPIPKFASSKISKYFAKTLTITGKSPLPILSGDYFMEEDSRTLDMDDKYGYLEIFKDGRIFQILLLPLSVYALIISYYLKHITSTNMDAAQFFSNYYDVAFNTGSASLYITFGIPILMAFILPIIWALTDSEIKRIQTHTDIRIDKNGKIQEEPEIVSVEDLGSILNQYLGLFVGLSTITGLYSIIRQLVGKTESRFDVIFIIIFIVLNGLLTVSPGAMLLAFRYFANGTHARSVNYLRYSLSRDNKVNVGKIKREYKPDKILDEPLSPTIKAQIVKLSK